MKSFVIADSRKCIGCGACEVACASANSKLPIPEAARLRAPFKPRLNLIFTPEVTMPIQCRQCEDAPCAKACPAEGIVFLDGVVHIRKENCIGCKMCILACPVGAVNILPIDTNLRDSEEGTGLPEFYAQKCELCNDRAEGPACVNICPAEAFTLIDETSLTKTVKLKREKILRSMTT